MRSIGDSFETSIYDITVSLILGYDYVILIKDDMSFYYDIYKTMYGRRM